MVSGNCVSQNRWTCLLSPELWISYITGSQITWAWLTTFTCFLNAFNPYIFTINTTNPIYFHTLNTFLVLAVQKNHKQTLFYPFQNAPPESLEKLDLDLELIEQPPSMHVLERGWNEHDRDTVGAGWHKTFCQWMSRHIT